MERFLGPYSMYLYAVLRFVAGLMFALHGSQKIFGVPGNRPAVLVASLAGAAGVIEIVAGVMIAIGLLTGYAAFIASGEMAVAYFIRHASQGFLPITNGGELAVLFCFLFLYLASKGSGPLSLDSIIRPRAKITAFA
jgi:putative oxidoreductase